MCTLVLASRMWPEAPLLVAANRDESLARASAGPQLLEERGTRMLAPRDLEAGGTWLGLNAAGVFVAITNRHNGVRNPDARSRGQLVFDALAEPSTEAAVRRISAADPRAHNPFHLVIADAEQAHIVWSDGRVHRLEHLPPGIHVVTERSFAAAPSQRLALLNARVQALATPHVPSVATWKALLAAHHQSAPLEGVCVHAPSFDYGTRSSSVLVWTSVPQDRRFLHADGPPCTTDYTDLSPLLHTLLPR